MKFFSLFLIFVGICNAEEYQFVAIENLTEQEIGQVVLPQIYKSLKIDIKITPFPGKRAQEIASSGISDGEIMRIFSYGYDNQSIFRVPTPYYFLETMAFIKKGSGVKITTKEDLRKYSIVKIRGVKHTDNITEGLANVTALNSTIQMMKFIERGRADVALTSRVDGLLALKELEADNVIAVERPLAILALFHYIHEDHKELIPKVDAKIIEMNKSGELDKIIKDAEVKVIGDLLPAY